MANRYPYADPYLAPHVTREREDRAAALVAELGTLPGDWPQRLTVLQAYVITCTECMQSADDLFSAKLSAYRKGYGEALTRARQAAAQAAAAAGGGNAASSVFSVELFRG